MTVLKPDIICSDSKVHKHVEAQALSIDIVPRHRLIMATYTQARSSLSSVDQIEEQTTGRCMISKCCCMDLGCFVHLYIRSCPQAMPLQTDVYRHTHAHDVLPCSANSCSSHVLRISRLTHKCEPGKQSPAGACQSAKEAVTQQCPGASRLHQVCVLGCTQGAS